MLLTATPSCTYLRSAKGAVPCVLQAAVRSIVVALSPEGVHRL